MARTRLDLRKIFLDILTSINKDYNKNHLFYREPSSGMKYPCIIYKHSGDNNKHADNLKYLQNKRYTVTVVDEDPDSILNEEVSKIPYCSFDREYEADGLNHFVYTLFY